ncbi:transcription initiation factor TFIID subunit 7-like [Lineus longissimus]|uniref:transcription initiation factor TFIID subunit 7-like n=1 Tax=Lineus longissimus TaxID=88925 RepID=UPI002B4F1D41
MKKSSFASKSKSKSKSKPKVSTKINLKGLKKHAAHPPATQLKKGPPPKKKDEPALDVEQQFILRLPPGPAMALAHDVESGAMNLKDKLFIEMQPDQKHGLVRYGNDMFHSKLVDLPCILESLKTTDNKTFYKTAEICQMLICSVDEDNSQDETESPKKKDKDKKYLYPHGLTPPLKNVRKRRFRKTLKKRYTEQPDIEKEVKRLFRTDNEAVHVKWEIVTDDDDKLNKTDEMGVEGKTQSQKIQGDINIEHIFGEVSSSEDDDEKDVNIMDSGDEYIGEEATQGKAVEAEADDDDDEDDDDEEEDDDQMTADMENEIRAKLDVLSMQIEELHEKRIAEEEKINTIDNVALRERFQSAYDDLVREEEEKTKEYEILSSMLS